MAFVYPGSAAIPDYESSLAKFLPAFEKGQTERKDSDAFDAAAKAFGGKGAPAAKEPTFLERLVGPFTRPQPGQTATAAIDTAAPQTTMQRVTAAETRPNTGMTSIAPDAYRTSVRAAESGGSNTARNPNSSAEGPYQFLKPTWDGIAQKYPELGLTPDGRTDPEQNERAFNAFTRDNAAALSQAGIPVNPGTLYAAHFLGAGGATKALSADPSTPMSAVVDPAVIQANPQLQNQTVGDFAQWANSKGGNGSGGYQPPMRDEGAGQGQPFVPDEATMRTLLASEATRPLAMSLIKAQQDTQASQGRFVTEQGQDGSIWQRDTLTGERSVLQQPGGDLDRKLKEAQIAAISAKPAVAPMSVPAGNTVVDPTTGKPIFSAPAAPADIGDVGTIRKEIQQLPSYKNMAQALPIYNSMVETAGRNSKASDLNLVYGLGKIMDPTSVVREGEMVMVQNTSSLPDWLQGAIASLNGGAALTPETRAAIMKEAYGRVKGYDSSFQNDVGQYQGIAERNRLNPADIIPSFSEYTEWTPAVPGEDPATAAAPAVAAPQAPITDGTVIENDAGQRLVLRNGQWESQ